MSSEVKVKQCNMNCGTQIFWSVEDNFYKEVLSGKRHYCPNYKKPATTTAPTVSSISTAQPVPASQLVKRKMVDSVVILYGSELVVVEGYKRAAADIQKINGKIHGTQSHVYIVPQTSAKEFCLFVYYEYPETPENQFQ
jgi:hypothetical protein